MEDLMDRVEIAHDLIIRLRQLLTMEKTDSVMDHSLNRTRFFKMDDDYSKHIFYLYLRKIGTKYISLNVHLLIIWWTFFRNPERRARKYSTKGVGREKEKGAVI